MEVFQRPYSPQLRGFSILIHSSGGVLCSYSPQWGCFYMLIHPNGGVTSSLFTAMEMSLHPPMEVFSYPHSPRAMFFVYEEVATVYTLILTGNCRSTWNIGKALSSMPCLSFKVLFILCFILAKLWLSYLWVSKSIRRDPTGLCCIYLLAVCTPWSKDIHGWYPKLTLL